MSEIYHNPLFLLASTLLVLGIISWLAGRENWSLFLLISGSLALRFWAAQLDPYLHNSDERWHALVAKNFMADPFIPRLRLEPILSYKFQDWCCNYYWLHKPPEFMWQMAASMKIFGVNLLAMRLPTILMGAAQSLLIFRLGSNLIDRRAGWLAALFFSVSYHDLELTAGNFPCDHNDTAALFYITASFWALSEFLKRKTIAWAIAVGLFAGLAVLNKWLIGMTVFAGWSVAIASQILIKKESFWLQIRPFLTGFAAAALLSLPWFLWIKNQFPLEFAHEQALNFRHITEVIEGHDGGPGYYFEKLPVLFSPLFLLLPTGLLMLIFRKNREPLTVAVAYSLIGTWLFFSLVAQTKMPGFIFLTASTAFILMAIPFDWLLKSIEKKAGRLAKPFLATTIFFSVWLLFQPGRLAARHDFTRLGSRDLEERTRKTHNTVAYKNLDSWLPPGAIVLFPPDIQDVDAMFFSSHPAYGWADDHAVDSLLNAGRTLATFNNLKPDWWFEKYNRVIKIDYSLHK